MPQYFVPPENISESSFKVVGLEAHHMSVVMRIKAGETIEIFDGRGKRYLASLQHSAKNSVAGKIILTLDPLESEKRIALCFALVSRPAIEDILQHASEIGVACFQPMITARTQVRFKDKWAEKLSRWNQILLASCKQCGRASIPDISEPAYFKSFLTGIPSLIAWEKEKNVSLGDALKTALRKSPEKNNIRLFVGPEGGFTEAEIKMACASGAVPFTLGKRMLRSETASCVASALILNNG